MQEHKGRLPARVTIYPVGEAQATYAEVGEDVATLRAQAKGQAMRIAELEQRINGYRVDLERLRGEYENLQGEHARLQETRTRERDTIQGRLLRGLASPSELPEVLRANSLIYRKVEEELLRQSLRASAEQLSQREWYLDTRLKDALEILKGKRAYETQEGKRLFEMLPVASREAALQQWGHAQSVVNTYDKKIPPLDVLVRIKSSRAWFDIMIPYDGTAANPVAKAFNQAWKNFLKAAESELGYSVANYKITESRPFASAQVRGPINFEALESKFYEAFRDVAERARLNLVLLYATSYLSYERPKVKARAVTKRAESKSKKRIPKKRDVK